MRRVAMMAVLTATLGVSQVLAGGMNMADIGAEAKWAAKIDFKAMRESTVGQAVMKGPHWEEFATKMATMKEVIGIDLANDLDSATLYGTDYGEKNNVVIVRGAMDAAKIKGLLSLMKEYDVAQTASGDVHTWVDEHSKKTAACGFAGSGTAVMAESAELVADAISVLNGTAACLKDGDGLHLPADDAGLFFSFAAKEDNGRIGRHKQAAMAGQADWMAFGVGEAAGKIRMSASIGAKTEQSAMQIEQLLQGIKALGLMSEDLDDQSREILSACSVSRTGTELAVSMEGNVEIITKAIEDARKRSALSSSAAVGDEGDVAPAAE